MERLGLRTGELHAALAIDTDNPAFQVEPVTIEDVGSWVRDTEEQATAAFKSLERLHKDASLIDARELIEPAARAAFGGVRRHPDQARLRGRRRQVADSR